MISKKVCPSCGSDEIVMVDRTGGWMCKSCNYAGRDIEEEEIVMREEPMMLDKKATRRKRI